MSAAPGEGAEPRAGAEVAERPVGPGDPTLLAALHARAFPDGPWSARAFGDLLAVPGTRGRLRYRGRQPLAFALWRLLGSEAEILTLATEPAARRQGHAAALLAGVLRDAAAAGAVRVLLEVADDNPAARRLYARQGFSAIALRAGYYRRRGGGRIDAHLLEWRATGN